MDLQGSPCLINHLSKSWGPILLLPWSLRIIFCRRIAPNHHLDVPCLLYPPVLQTISEKIRPGQSSDLFEIYVFWNLKEWSPLEFHIYHKKTTKTQLYVYPAKNVTFMGSKWWVSENPREIQMEGSTRSDLFDLESPGMPVWWSRWWFQSNMFYFHPYLGKMIPILTNIFQFCWNHQLLVVLFVYISSPVALTASLPMSSIGFGWSPWNLLPFLGGWFSDVRYSGSVNKFSRFIWNMKGL